jgi:c-di-GMP-related signal transduction protein
MKLTKIEFEAIEGVKYYQLVNEANLIVGITSGFGSKENEVIATLFENAPELLKALKDLTDLKDRKYHIGKDDFYVEKQKEAWLNARKVITNVVGS